MSDHPISTAPEVDFSQPYSYFRHLATQRQRLAGAVEEINAVGRDISKYNSEGAFYADCAAAWAATLMVADILKHSLAAMDRRAAVLFRGMDDSLARANRVLKLLGVPTIATRQDVLRGVDPNLKGTVKLMEDVQKVRGVLKQNKVNLPKEANLLLDLGIAMTEDSVLILQANQTKQAVATSANAAQASLKKNLDRLKQSIRRIDAEMSRIIEEAQRQAHIA